MKSHRLPALAFLFLTSVSHASTEEKFEIDGAKVSLKIPTTAAEGKPWLWIGEFAGHLKSLEAGLVEKGWHVAHVAQSNKFGSPNAMAVWEKLYTELHGKRGLSAKPALLGISRGGLYVNAWLRLHPDRASVLYLDNAVCDPRSWPGGFELTKKGRGSKGDWTKYKTKFGFADDESALEKSIRPTDQLLPAIQAGVLLISCHGTADRIVPYEDNAAKLVEFWEQNKGRVKVFPKENGDHHPHGLPDPAPIIDLLVSETRTITPETVNKWSAPFRNWHYHPDHVIPAKPGIPGYDKVHMTDVPTVFQIPGDPKWYMSYVGFDGGGYQSFVAESDDLVNWTKHRLAMGYGPEGEFDHGGVVLGAYLYESYDIKATRTLKKKDGKFWSLYGAYDKRTGYEAGTGSNGLTVSDDGLTWRKFQKDPVVSIHDADCGPWESKMIYMPWLTEHEGTYHSHYNAKGGPEQTGVVTSKDLLKWTRYEKNPVIPVGATVYNSVFSADPKIFRDGDHWTCFFFGVGKGGAHIMAAYSRDLFQWTVDPEPLYKAGGNPSGLDKQFAHKISLVWNPANETYYMFYNAVGNKGRGIGLITSKPLAP